MERRRVMPLVLVGGFFVLATVVLSILGAVFDWGDDGSGWGHMGWGGGWTFLMPLGMVAFWGLVIWAIVAFGRAVGPSSQSGAGRRDEESALEVLRKRYARGGISKEEYEEMRHTLV